MSAIHERMVDRYIKHPDATATAYWGDGAPLDSHTSMLLASNAAHLALESRRQLVFDLGSTGYTGKDTWAGLVDVAGPSEADRQLAPETYSHVSWAPTFTRRYGPFVAICDREASSGEFVLRRIKGRINWSGTGGGTGAITTALHCALTTHADPQAVVQGDLVAYTRITETGGAFNSYASVDWTPSVTDQTREILVCRRGASGAIGPTRVYVTLVWIWICVCAQSGVDVNSVSFWESV